MGKPTEESRSVGEGEPTVASMSSLQEKQGGTEEREEEQEEEREGDGEGEEETAVKKGLELKLQKAKDHKQKGNEWLKKGKYAKAVREYRTVFAYVNGLVGGEDKMAQYAKSTSHGEDLLLSSEDEARVKEIRVSVHCNLAAVYLKQKKYDRTIESADEALELDNKCLKALLRKGKALMLKGNLEEAKKVFMKANQVDPGNSAVKGALREWKATYQSWKSKGDESTKKMFGGIWTSSNPSSTSSTSSTSSSGIDAPDTDKLVQSNDVTSSSNDANEGIYSKQ